MSDIPFSEQSEAELLEHLGRELVGVGIGFGPSDPGRYRRYAERWIDQRSGEIRKAICYNDSIKAIFAKDLQDRFNDVAVIADALSTLQGHPPVALLAVVLVRRGFDAICHP